MKQNKTQQEKGIAHIGIVLLIIAVVAAVAFGGWYVWQKNKDDKQTDNTTQTSNNQTTNNTQADPTDGGKYLVIKEWGVRFLLPEELRGDVEYGIETDPNNLQTAWFEIKTFANTPGSTCYLSSSTTEGYSGKRGGVGAFLKQTTNQIPESQTAFYYKANLKIGNYWYSGGRERYSESCINDSSKEQALIDSRSSLIYAFENLESVPQQ